MKNIIVFLALFTFLAGCGKEQRIFVYSMDKSQCITVFNYDGIRYVVDGEYAQIPDTNYVKLDISHIDPLGDGLHICWKGGSGWDAVVHNSRIIEMKLDTVRCSFGTELPTDSLGIPNEMKFREDNCAIFDFYRMKLSPNKGAIIN